MADQNGWTVVPEGAPAGWTRVEEEIKAAEPKTWGGFGENLMRSTGDAFVNTAKGVPAMVKGIPGAVRLATLPFRMISDPVETSKEAADDGKSGLQLLRGLKKYVGDRYGSPSQAWDTAYQDPAGVALDASTVFGGGSLGAKAAGLSRTAKVLSTASDFTNPLLAITKPIGATLKQVAKVPVITTLQPKRALRDDFGGAGAIANTVLDERLFREPRATSVKDAATADRNASLARLDAQGIVVPAQKIADGLNDARTTARQDVRLGHPDLTPNIDARSAQILQQGDVPVGEAQTLKQRAQALANDSRTRNQRKNSLSVDELADDGVAKAYKTSIEDAGRAGGEPNIEGQNERIQRLIGGERAWKDATDRSHALSTLVSMAAAAATPGSTKTKFALAAGLKALDMPQVGVPLGIGTNEVGRLLSNPRALRAALLSRLAGGAED